MDRIRDSIQDRELIKEVLESLHRIFQNIIDNPFDNKYRKLKIGSKFYKNYIEPYRDVKLFLEYVNFIPSGEFLVNNTPTEQIENIFNDITNFAVALSNFYKFNLYIFFYSFQIDEKYFY